MFGRGRIHAKSDCLPPYHEKPLNTLWVEFQDRRLISLRGREGGGVRKFLMWIYWRAQRAIGAAGGFGGAVSPPRQFCLFVTSEST